MKTVEEMTDQAEAFVRSKGFNGLADHTMIKNWMAEFAVAHANDAVADTKAFYESLFAELKQSDLQLVEIYAQAEVGRLQAEKRNAALVAVLEYLLKSARDARIADDTMREVMWDVCEHALAANEKGGKGE